MRVSGERLESGLRGEVDIGFVLHRRPYRETSLLIDAFAERSGRLRLLAKGAQRGRHPLARALQAFQGLRLAWIGSGDLVVLTGAEVDTAEGRSWPAGSALYCGLYLNELLMHFLPLQDPHPRLFERYQQSLVALARPGVEDLVLRHFELDLLGEVGYALVLDREVERGEPVEAEGTYRYEIGRGPIAVEPHRQGVVHGQTLLGLARRELTTPEQRREAKHLMRRVLHHFLEGRELRSRRLFNHSLRGRT